jgi:[acyl-carrier-protein] S-malonyltransferase
MFERLCTDPLIAAHVDRLAGVLEWDAMAVARDPQRCFENRHAQPLICLHVLSVAAALREQQIEPALVAGYSVGELAAYGVAGALTGEDVLVAAAARARAMDDCAPADCGMLAVRGVRRAALEARATADGLHVAIRNGDDHAIIAGPCPRLAALGAALGESGAHVVSLPITVPAHSALLQPAVAAFGMTLASVSWRRMAVPVIAGIDASVVRDARHAIDKLSRQVATTIEWARVMDVAVEMGATVFFELGPGNALSRMLSERHGTAATRALGDFSSLAGAVSWLRRECR